MKKKEQSEPKVEITKLDVAKLLGMDVDYNAGKLEGDLKELYEELLKEEDSGEDE